LLAACSGAQRPLPSRQRREALGRWRHGAQEGARAVKDQGTLVERWRGAFFALLESSEMGPRLKEAAVEGALGAWTAHLTAAVVSGLSMDVRRALGGETCLVVGNRGEAETFPYGYFKVWGLDPNTGRFART